MTGKVVLHRAEKRSGVRRLKLPRARRGQGMVEFALGIPFMLMILLGTIDMGRLFFEFIELRGAVREGVAAAARENCSTANAVAQAAVLAHAEILNDGGTTITNLTYSPACPATYDDPSAFVSISASRAFQPVFTEFLSTYFGIDGSIPMGATASAKVWT